MQTLNNEIDKFVRDLTVKAMLNPNNKDFYIPNLNLGKVYDMCHGKQSWLDMIWSAFKIAYPQYKADQEDYKNRNNIQTYTTEEDQPYHEPGSCPCCGYRYYQGYVKCPNCDFCEY